MTACFHSAGRLPSFKDSLKSRVSGRANASAQDFKKIEGSPSGPPDLSIDKHFSSSQTSCAVIVISSNVLISFDVAIKSGMLL